MCWVDAGFKKRACDLPHPSAGFNYYWFAQLDETPTLELFLMSGWDDGSNFRLYRFHATTWTSERLFGVNPGLRSAVSPTDRLLYWGYPWDVHDLVVEKPRKILGASELRPLGEWDCDSNSNLDMLVSPVIVFTGVSTQKWTSDLMKGAGTKLKDQSLARWVKVYTTQKKVAIRYCRGQGKENICCPELLKSWGIAK